ncbi:MAG TPA: AAA family ATPase [Thermoanaerobaculia bacterium]|jgi:predicted ATPase
MIQSLSIRNFKVLREVGVKLQPLTVIVGPNASGKTSILQAIEVISAWLNRSPFEALQRWDPNIFLSRNSTGPALIGCQVLIQGKAIYFKINLSSRETTDPSDGTMKWSCTFLNLNTERLAASSYPKSLSLKLPSNGDGLPSILAGLQLEDPSKFAGIVSQLRDVVPSLSDIRVRQIQIESDRVGHELLFDLKGAQGVRASSISEGTLLTLGVLTALSTCDSPQVVLIDDIERGLHPKALKDYIEQIRLLQKKDPELQIIATSHSPYLLDYLQAEEILLTSLDDEGYAVVKPLTDHPEYERWKDLMDPGEFWSSVGEDWIVQEKKATA